MAGTMVERDWQTARKTIRERNAFMFNNHLMSDVKLVVLVKVDVERHSLVRVPAHKYVLAISSPVFYAMFYGKMNEKRDEVDFRDCDYRSLMEFLRYVYYDEINLTLENAIGILHIARKYMVPSLVKQCAAVLEKSVNSNKVFELLIQARRYNATSLERRCWEIIDKNTNQCIQSDSLLCIDRETLVCFLKREALMIEELEVFRAAWRWAEARCREKELEPNGRLAREVLGDALYNIRFPAMTLEQFTAHVEPCGILSDRENIMLYFYFTCSEADLNPPFPLVPRRQTKSVIRFSRYSHVTDLAKTDSNELSRTEFLSFYTNQPVYLHGLRLFADDTGGCAFEAEVRLMDGAKRELAFTSDIFYTDQGGITDICGFDVSLDIPILIRRKAYYKLEIKISGVDGSRVFGLQSQPQARVSQRGIDVNFEGQSTQLLELLL